MKNFFIIILFILLNGLVYSQTEVLSNQTYQTSVTTGELCYYTGTQWDEANATTESATSYGMIGIALGNNQILTKGVWRTTGLTPGSIYYISTSAGTITATAPSTTNQVVRVIGYALSSTQLKLDVDNTWVVHP